MTFAEADAEHCKWLQSLADNQHCSQVLVDKALAIWEGLKVLLGATKVPIAYLSEGPDFAPTVPKIEYIWKDHPNGNYADISIEENSTPYVLIYKDKIEMCDVSE